MSALELLAAAPSNSNFRLAATAVVSGAVVAGAILGCQRLQREQRLSRLKDSIPRLDNDGESPQTLTGYSPDKEDLHNQALARRAQAGDFDDELILEQLARNRVFLGPQGLEKLRASFVIIVGCGGVGSHCAAALARSGVSRIRLVDFDQVTLSSLNRHAVATLADVGLPKVQCLQRRLMAVTPWVDFDLRLDKFDATSAESLMSAWKGGAQRPDFVVDAIDNIDTKIDLLKFCHDAQLPVISAMGAGTKSDPTRIRVGDISATTDDALSRATRRGLKLKGITKGIPVVFSTEAMGEGKAALLPLPEEEFQKGTVGDLGVLPDFRVRILPVLGTMPAVFGYTAANHVILSISGYPLDYVPVKGGEKMYDSILASIQSTEDKTIRAMFGGKPDVTLGLKTPITIADIAFMVEEVYRGRSIVSRVPTRLVLIRWEKPKALIMVTIGGQKSSNLRLRDLVCMTRDEAAIHLREVLQGDKAVEDVYEADVVEKARAKMAEAEKWERYRL